MLKKFLFAVSLVAGLSAFAHAAKQGPTTVINTTSKTSINATDTILTGFMLTNTSTFVVATAQIWSNTTSTFTYVAVPVSSTIAVSLSTDAGAPEGAFLPGAMHVTHSATTLTGVYFWRKPN